MRVTGVRSRVVNFPLDAPFYPAWSRGRAQTSLEMAIFEVVTDDGLVGVGATTGGLTSAVAIDRFVTPHLIGHDPTDIEQFARVIRDAEILGPPAYCMEIPLWDLLGQAAGLPVFRLWGGATTRVRAYCSTGELRPPQIRAANIDELADGGFKAVKLRFHHADPRDDLAVVEAVRTRVGESVDLMVDANQASVDPGAGGHEVWDFHTALAVAQELEQLGVTWLEEPLPRYRYRDLARLRNRLETLKLAGGEDNHGLHEFHGLLESQCFDILQPDATKSETASAIRKLAGFAELAGVRVIPHTWGLGLTLLVHLHLAASLTNCGWVEFPHDPPSGFTATARDQMLAETVVIDDQGYVEIPERPGFGFVLNENRIARYTTQVIEHGDCGLLRSTGHKTPTRRRGVYEA